MKAGTPYLVALFAASQMTAAADLSGAFSQGQAMGAAGNATIQSNITAGQGAGVVPNYTSSATESGYFSGGQGSLFGPATGKISGCATGPKNPDPYQQQDCDAINFLARNPAQRQQFSIGKNDPLLTGAKSILANPAAPAGSMDGNYSSCSTQTVNQPAQYSTEVCNQYTDMTQSTCQKVLTVAAIMQHDCANGQIYEWWTSWVTYGAWNSAGVQFRCDTNNPNKLVFSWLYLTNTYGIGRPATRSDLSVNPGIYVLDATPCTGHYSGAGSVSAYWYNGKCTVVGWSNPTGFGGGLMGVSIGPCDSNICLVTLLFVGVGSSFNIASNQATQTITKSWDNQCSVLEARAQ